MNEISLFLAQLCCDVVMVIENFVERKNRKFTIAACRDVFAYFKMLEIFISYLLFMNCDPVLKVSCLSNICEITVITRDYINYVFRFTR